MVTSGLDVLRSERADLVAARKVAVLCHPPSLAADLRHIVDVLIDLGADLRAIFGPEHGFGGEAQDMDSVAAAVHPTLGVPIHSLYGATAATLAPRREALADVDVLVIDLQDVGSRYYTYVWTALLAMQVCSELGVAVLVLDRPNPLCGSVVEGPGIEPGFRSFVGQHSVAVRHGLTIAELLQLARRELSLQVELRLVPMRDWSRQQYWDQSRLPWILPSPNMPTLDTALVYPGACLIEGTNLSEGRGTTRPFELIGAPWIDGVALARALDKEGMGGVSFRPISFRPMFQKHAGRICGGVQIHVTDRRSFAPFRCGVALLSAAARLRSEHFAWRTDAYEFVHDRPAIDLLAGGDWLRQGIEAGCCSAELAQGWPEHEQSFVDRRRPFLLYPEPQGG